VSIIGSAVGVSIRRLSAQSTVPTCL
jgi:hypothetical protein